MDALRASPLTVAGGLLFSGEGGKRRDPLSGQWLDERVVYWKMQDSAAAPAIDPPPPGPACQVRLAELQAQLDDARRALAQDLPLNLRFAEGAVDPAAQKEVQGLVDRALVAVGDPQISAQVTCRGGICKIQLHSTDPASALQTAHARIIGSRDLRIRFGSSSSSGWSSSYHPLRDRASGESMAVLLDLHARLKAGAVVQRCRATQGGSGPFGGSVWIGEREVSPPPETEVLPNGISFSFGPKAPTTPDGACIIEAFRRAAHAIAVPSHRTAAHLPFWLFHPDQPGVFSFR
jgi:hypothetical protein